MKLCGIVYRIHIYHHNKFWSDWMNRSSGVIKQRIILFLRSLGYFFCRNIVDGPSTTGLTMKTLHFFFMKLSGFLIIIYIYHLPKFGRNQRCLEIGPVYQCPPLLLIGMRMNVMTVVVTTIQKHSRRLEKSAKQEREKWNEINSYNAHLIFKKVTHTTATSSLYPLVDCYFPVV